MMKSRCKTAKMREKGDQTLRTELDLHTHTLVSGHAYSTIREMARMASEKGLKILGITEHAPQMPGSCHEFYFQNLTVVPREMYGVRLLLGAMAISRAFMARSLKSTVPFSSRKLSSAPKRIRTP